MLTTPPPATCSSTLPPPSQQQRHTLCHGTPIPRRHGTTVAVKLLIDSGQAAAAASSGAPLATLTSPVLEKLEAEAEIMLGIRCGQAGLHWPEGGGRRR